MRSRVLSPLCGRLLITALGPRGEGEGGGGEGGAGGGTGGEGGGAGGGTGAGGGEGGGQPKTYSEAEYQKLQTDLDADRKKLTALEKKLQEIDDANLSEADKLKKRAEEAEGKVTAAQQRIAKAEVLVAAAKANLVDADAVWQLIRDRIAFDEQGEPKDVEALITQLAKDKPYLVKTEGGGGTSAANPNRNTGGGKSDFKKPPSWNQVFKR